MITVPKIGQRVRIIRKDSGVNTSGTPFYGMLAFITRIQGGMIYVRPRWYTHEHELYRHEIQAAPYNNT